MWAGSRESDQAERNRREAWEKAQEAKLAQIREEYERKFGSMQEEINTLKGHLRQLESATKTVSSAPQSSAPDIPRDMTPFQDLTQDHLPDQDTPYPLFVQGSSTDPTPYQGNGILDSLIHADGNVTNTRKRTTSPSSDDDESSDDDGLSSVQRPTKRVNGHDTRCLTIQVYEMITID